MEELWRALAARQAGLITRAQLHRAGVSARAIAWRIRTERWQPASPTVISVTTGEISREQRRWLGVLHAGRGSLVGGVAAAELAGLAGWHRDIVTVLVPYAARVPAALDGFRFSRSRRDPSLLRGSGPRVPHCRLEPAVLLFAAREPFPRTRSGILAAVVQQRLSTADLLLQTIERLKPLPHSAELARTLADIGGGAQSVAELDINRMCRVCGLARPRRQVRRRDAGGRWRYTDCEWMLRDGTVLVLEIDGAFHMEAQSWEEDLARQRALSGTGRIIVRCTARELRDEPETVGRDLHALGVPLAA